MINAKEEIDRNTLELPEEQEMLLDRIAEANPNTVLVLFTNYPYTLQKAMENCRRSSCLQREARIWEAQWQRLCLEPMHRPAV